MRVMAFISVFLLVVLPHSAFSQNGDMQYQWSAPDGSRSIELDLWTAFRVAAKNGKPPSCIADVPIEHGEYGPITFGLYSEPPRNVLSKRIDLLLSAEMVAMPPRMHREFVQYKVQLPSGDTQEITALVVLGEKQIKFLSPEIPPEMLSVMESEGQIVIDLGRITGSGVVSIPLEGFNEAIEEWNSCTNKLQETGSN